MPFVFSQQGSCPSVPRLQRFVHRTRNKNMLFRRRKGEQGRDRILNIMMNSTQ